MRERQRVECGGLAVRRGCRGFSRGPWHQREHRVDASAVFRVVNKTGCCRAAALQGVEQLAMQRAGPVSQGRGHRQPRKFMDKAQRTLGVPGAWLHNQFAAHRLGPGSFVGRSQVKQYFAFQCHRREARQIEDAACPCR
jgi:hypothetical protein